MKSIFSLVLFLVSWSDGFAAAQTVRLSIPSMNCPACPITVRKALERVAGVASIEVDLGKKQATVTFDDARTSVHSLIQATGDAGYPASVVEVPGE